MTEAAQPSIDGDSAPASPSGGNGLSMVNQDRSVRPYHNMSALDDPANLQIILDRIASGTTQRQIAAELGCDPAALSRRLRQHPDHMLARELHHEAKLDEELAIMREAAASADVNLVRAWEATLRRTEWRAEREHPARWGAKAHEINIAAAGPVAIQVVSYAGAETMPRVTDVMSTAEPASAPTDSGAWCRGGRG